MKNQPTHIKEYLATSVMPLLQPAIGALLVEKAELESRAAKIDSYSPESRNNMELKQFSPLVWLAEYLREHNLSRKSENAPENIETSECERITTSSVN